MVRFEQFESRTHRSPVNAFLLKSKSRQSWPLSNFAQLAILQSIVLVNTLDLCKPVADHNIMEIALNRRVRNFGSSKSTCDTDCKGNELDDAIVPFYVRSLY